MREAFARAAYSVALRLLQPAYTLRLWLRGRAEPLYRERIGERFGFYAEAPSAGWLWLHAVSLGETRAAAALVDALRAERPGLRLLLTHGTATGCDAGRALLHDGDRQTWLPYDTPGAVQRFFAQFRPALGVLMETEVWPNLLLAARTARVPMVLANARLSEKSARRGRRFNAVLRPAIDSVALVLAQTEVDAQRIRQAGARTVEVSGNLKYDLTPDSDQLAQGAAWQALVTRGVVLAAITREGEEAMLLDAWQRTPRGDALLVIVPRHPQRFDEIAALVRAAGFSIARRSAWQGTPPADALQAQVWLGDSMREMALYYAAAQVALLGGSFAPLGGHNLIEAAACGCPLVMGPSTFNFSEAAELSLAAGASLRAEDMHAAVALALQLLHARDRRRELSTNALRFASQHRGAAQRMARRIAPMMAS
ncbi:MAG: 3-deoxy-D-manno-octulosonic acid transferase [Rhizobiales bacterium]|nr:3-deoxy-D-manno-octulosonic acid transferase [Rhizobacter sp.]